MGDKVMIPSQYNYIKRMWTRNILNKKRGIFLNIFLLPFKICILSALTIIYAGLIFTFLGIQILFKLIFEFIKIIFKFCADFICGFIKMLKNNNHQYIEKEKPILYQVKDFIDEYGYADVSTIQRKFKISYHNAMEIIKEIELIEKQ